MESRLKLGIELTEPQIEQIAKMTPIIEFNGHDEENLVFSEILCKCKEWVALRDRIKEVVSTDLDVVFHKDATFLLIKGLSKGRVAKIVPVGNNDWYFHVTAIAYTEAELTKGQPRAVEYGPFHSHEYACVVASDIVLGSKGVAYDGVMETYKDTEEA